MEMDSGGTMAMALWHYGTMALWYYGTMALEGEMVSGGYGGLLGDYLGTTWGLLGDYLGTTCLFVFSSKLLCS